MYVEFRNTITKDFLDGYFFIYDGINDAIICINKKTKLYSDINSYTPENVLNDILDYNIIPFYAQNFVCSMFDTNVFEVYFKLDYYSIDTDNELYVFYCTPTGIVPYIEYINDNNIINTNSYYSRVNTINNSDNYNIYNYILKQYGMGIMFYTKYTRPYTSEYRLSSADTAIYFTDSENYISNVDSNYFNFDCNSSTDDYNISIYSIKTDDLPNNFIKEFSKPFIIYKFYNTNKMIDNIAFTRRLINASKERRNKNA